MEPTDVLYETDGPLAVVTLNRPRYRNAQSYRLLDQLDDALQRAAADHEVKVIIVQGAGEHFSSGHDLGTPESIAYREEIGVSDSGIGYYEAFRKYNLELTLKWRNLPKPTIAMVRGYCIYGGWMIASAMDLIFAAEDARFLAGLVEYFSIPWDVGHRKAKELLYESRFIDAAEARELGFVNRVLPAADLERETFDYARRVAEQSHYALRMAKLAVNKMQDAQGYSSSVEAAFADYLVAANPRGGNPEDRRVPGVRRLSGVDLALRGERGERPGLGG
jgi:enoyl-CoA hydratase